MQKFHRTALRHQARLRRLADHDNMYPAVSLSLAAAAALAGLESTYFSAYYHRVTAITFRHWYDSRRIHHACELLENSDVSVTEIAMASGFNDLRTFERTFRRVEGVTAKAWRRRCAATDLCETRLHQ
jgi:AraC-like DNA-binding protein